MEEFKEYLDVVNENDEVVGRDTRKNIHAENKTHREVHVFIINPTDRKILVQKRSKNIINYPGCYDASVGAHVLSGESYEQAAKREVEEEVGIKPKGMKHVLDYKSYLGKQQVNRRLFVCYSAGPFEIDKRDVELVRFFSPEDIKKEIETGKMNFTQGFKLSFRHYLKFMDQNPKP